MNKRDRRIIEAMIGEADDWHIVDPDTGAEIDQDAGIAVTPDQFKSLLAGESAVVGLTRRVVTLADGPFSIRGGPGSGFFGHAGRPGEVGGSSPSGEVAEEATAGGSSATRINTDFIRGSLRIEVGQEDFDGIADILRHFNERVSVPGERGNAVRYIPAAKVTAALTATDEFWLFPDGSVVETGRVGHEEMAERTLARYFGEQRSRWSDAITVRRSTGFGGGEQLFVLRRPPGDTPHLLSEEVEIATGNVRENGSVEWSGYGMVGMGTTPTADVTPQQVIALNPDIAAMGLMRHTDREGLLAAFGMVRVSRGGTGGNEVGFSWDASLPPTEAQRRVVMHVANETMDTGGGFVYETLNQSTEHPGTEGVVESGTWSTARRAFAAAMAGNYTIQRSTLPDWALLLTVRGGPGSGFKGHKGRPGEVGGSEPSPLGPQEEHKPVKSKRKGQATTFDARTPVSQVKDLVDTVLAESEAGGVVASAAWHNLFRLANKAVRSVEAGEGPESVSLTDDQRTSLWLLYRGTQRLLDTTGSRDGLDAAENASLQRLGDIVGNFEPDLSEVATESGPAAPELLSLYVGDESTPGYLPEEITRDPYMRYQTGRIVARVAASMEGSQLMDYNGTENAYLDFAELQALANDNTFDPEAWNAVVETWGRRAVSEENTSEGAYAMREARLDPNFWAHNQVMELSIGQWLPTDVSPELYSTADLLNAGWKADPQHSTGGLALEEAAGRVFGGTTPERQSLSETPDTGLTQEAQSLDDPQTQERANRVVQGMYDATQQWLAGRGYHPGDTIRLYRGMGSIEGS